MPDSTPSPSSTHPVSAWRTLSVAARIAFRADPVRAGFVFTFSVASAAAGAFQAYGLKMIIDALVHHNAHGAYRAVAVTAGVFAISYVANWSSFMLRMGLRERTNLALDLRIIELTTGIPGLEHLERPEYADEVALLRDEREQLSAITDAMSANLQVFAMIVVTLGLLASIHPLLLALPLFGLPSLFAGAKAQRIGMANSNALAEHGRLRAWHFVLATKAAPGKELRVFGLGPELVRRYRQSHAIITRSTRRAEIQQTMWTALGWLIFAVGFVGAISFVAVRAAHHQASPGQVVLAFTLAAQVNGQVAATVAMVTFLLESIKTGRRFVWLIDYAADRKTALSAESRRSPAAVPARMTEGIRLEDVSFTYPGTERPVLEGVDLTVPAGTTVAVVGENGAGKTTLVKLLCRFYEPTTGRITVDGTDLRRFDLDEWRARLSAGFQDFAKYELRAQRVVGVGDLSHLDDQERAAVALDQASGADVVAGLPQGWDTTLGKSFDDGVELSGGQWQKLALGRALMRDAPLLLVLDEPTAALDAATEHALFERFTDAAHRAGAGAGAVTVVVSHRFSTVRMADLILVVDGGRIREAGTHDELAALGGLYAELYALQASGYR